MRQLHLFLLIKHALLSIALICLSIPAYAHVDLLTYGWQKVDGIDIFYREGGAHDAPTLV